MGIACTALMCHAPIVVPAIAGDRISDCEQTTRAMRALAQKIVAHDPDVLVVISPHSPRDNEAWGIVHDEELVGSFARFGRADLGAQVRGAPRAAAALVWTARGRGLAVSTARGDDLDHGALVPLTFLNEAGWRGRTLVVALPESGTHTEDDFGHAIAEAATRCQERWAVVASGDMSHRLTREAPGGYHPRAQDFDSAFVRNLRRGDLRAAISPDPRLQELAGEDVVRSTQVAAAASDYAANGLDVLSYEGPFGVGYTEAVLFSDKTADPPALPPRELTQIAHDAIACALERRTYRAPSLAEPWQAPRAVFVTLRSPDGTLRGCIGRTHPVLATLAAEVADCAISAATRDHRMLAVEQAELPKLRIEVSVLGPLAEIADESGLDPSVYGVVASQGGRCGVLLPHVEGINTSKEQVSLALKKGRIEPGEPYRLQRFRVQRVGPWSAT